jgi:hypothetical protein
MRINMQCLSFLLCLFPIHEALKTTCKNNIFQFRNISGKHRNRKPESPLGNSPVERKLQTLTGNHHLTPSAPAHGWPKAQCILRAPCWLWASLQGGLCLAHTEVHTLCVLHSNTWRCHRLSGCSFADTVYSWNWLRRWWICLSRSLRTLCYHHHT